MTEQLSNGIEYLVTSSFDLRTEEIYVQVRPPLNNDLKNAASQGVELPDGVLDLGSVSVYMEPDGSLFTELSYSVLDPRTADDARHVIAGQIGELLSATGASTTVNAD